jgi:Ca-activated chloride channel family protein
MTFQQPVWLLALLAVAALVAVYVLLQLRRKAYAARFTNVALLGSIVPKRPGWRRHLRTGSRRCRPPPRSSSTSCRSGSIWRW